MVEMIEEIVNFAMLEELFGKFDFLGIIDTVKIIEVYKAYLDSGETGTGITMLLFGLFALALRIALLAILVVFALRVWKIVSYHYFKIADKEEKMRIKKEFFARSQDSIVEEIAPKEPEEVETVKQAEETKEIEIPKQQEKTIRIDAFEKSDATKEVKIPKDAIKLQKSEPQKQQPKPKENTTLKEKINKFLFNE